MCWSCTGSLELESHQTNVFVKVWTVVVMVTRAEDKCYEDVIVFKVGSTQACGLHPRCGVDRVSKQTITGHFGPDDARHHWT